MRQEGAITPYSSSIDLYHARPVPGSNQATLAASFDLPPLTMYTGFSQLVLKSGSYVHPKSKTHLSSASFAVSLGSRVIKFIWRLGRMTRGVDGNWMDGDCDSEYALFVPLEVLMTQVEHQSCLDSPKKMGWAHWGPHNTRIFWADLLKDDSAGGRTGNRVLVYDRPFRDANLEPWDTIGILDFTKYSSAKWINTAEPPDPDSIEGTHPLDPDVFFGLQEDPTTRHPNGASSYIVSNKHPSIVNDNEIFKNELVMTSLPYRVVMRQVRLKRTDSITEMIYDDSGILLCIKASLLPPFTLIVNKLQLE